MAMGPDFRVADTDRDAVATQLREHYADGRLTMDELNERLDQTFAAKTRIDLDAVMRDLPYTPRPTATPPLAGSSTASGLTGAGAGSWDGGRRARGPLLIPALLAMWLFWLVVSAAAFGFGAGRAPFLVVIGFFFLSLIRRIFGGRRGGFGRSCRRGRRR
jgi:Domain of unknown function (DUF1707)